MISNLGMVMAHIAARRTDDPKLGVGCLIVVRGKYTSVGWNGYPKKCIVHATMAIDAHHFFVGQHLDYPQAGADDSVEDEELKYDYILHSGKHICYLFKYIRLNTFLK